MRRGWSAREPTRPWSEAERNAVTEVERRTCAYVGVRGGIGNGSPSSSSRDGTGRGNGRSPEDDGVCRLVASLMQHDAIPADLTTCSAPGLENRGRRFARPFAVLDHVNFSHIDPSVLSK